MNWRITETNQIDKEAIDRLGNKFLIGNGYLGYRGTLEEHTKDQKVATIVSGLYDKVGDRWREPINMPNGCYLRVSCEGVPLHAQFSAIDKHSQTLDIYQAIHERRTQFTTPTGNRIIVHSRRFVSLASHHLMCMEYVIEASQDCTLTVCTGIDGDVWDLNGPHLENFTLSQQDDDVLWLAATTHENHVSIAVAECTLYDGSVKGYPHEGQRILRQIELAMKARQPVAITKFVASFTSIDSQLPLADAQKLCREASQSGFEAQLAEHAALWKDRWEACDVQIKGDEEAEQALRFSIYHLLAIAPTHSDRASIPARGLSGQVYKGAIFWDTEIFMLPFFAYTFPSIARNLLMYRYHTLDGARRKAREYGYRGAYYAWESQDTGDDSCTLFNVTDVFTNRPMRTYFRDKQIHISADVVYAIWDYFSITQDDTIFADGCAEVIFECARFLLTYLYYSQEKCRFEVLDVTGPDEYHERVHNNAYTNQMVAHTFDICLRLHSYLKEHYPEQLAGLVDRLGFHRDLSAIQEACKGMYVPEPDPKSQLVPQFDRYFTLEDVPLGDLLLRKLHPHEYLGGGNGLATTTQVIKQADVILMMYLFSEKYSEAAKAANWNYYEPRTEHGSSLSACVYALVAAQIGKSDWAYKYFMKTASIDMLGEGKQYVGTLYIGGTHPASNGGAWMASVLGLCGIRGTGDTLKASPQLPRHWTEVTIRLTFRGQRAVIRLTQDDAVIQMPEPNEEALHPQ